MAGNRFNKAYEAYQQAVYRDGRNPTFWCSIGVLYYQINQYRDALDAYSRAIRLNSYIPEVWFNLGSLYESCNNQITDAIDAYTRAADLDPTNATIRQRLQILQAANANNTPLPEPPKPVDVHPSQYTAQPQGPYPPGASPGNSPRPVQMPNAGPELSDTQNGRALPPPPPGGDLGRGHSPGPFRGGAAPPPLQQVDESRGSMSRHAPLAPMDTDMPLRGPRDPRDHRAPDNFPPSRYDPAAEAASRRQGSPASPRRREGYPTYQPYYGRDRERDEWERRNSRGLPGPSPRLHERSIQAPGRQPSPRHPEYAYGYPPDSRAQYPYDHRREMTPSNGAAPRHPSGSYDDTRAPSPAPSSIVSASGRRKRDDEPRSAKKEKSVTKKSSGDKKTSLKVTLRTGASSDETSPTNEEDELSRDGPHERAPPSLPSRTVDEGEC
jgi:glucose repression mediator protein